MGGRRVVRLLSASLLLAACTSPLVPPTPFVPSRSTPIGVVRATSTARAEAEARRAVLMPVVEALLADLNQEREALGLPPLQASPMLIELAFVRAEDMTARSYLASQDPASGRPLPLDLMGDSGFGGRLAEVLLATSAPLDDLPATALAEWLTSPSHRDVILDPGYRYAGTGVMGDSRVWRVVLLLAENGPQER